MSDRKVSVVLQLREQGMTQPIEDANGKCVWTTRRPGERFFGHRMSLQEFNTRAPALFDMDRPPGFRIIPQVEIEPVQNGDGDSAERLRLLEEANAALKADNETLRARIAELSQPPTESTPSEGAAKITMTVELLKAKMAERKWQTHALSQQLGIGKEALEAFIAANPQEFHLSEKGGWINDGPKPANPLLG